MMNRKRTLAVATVGACGALTLSLWAADLTLDQIPAKAREALLKLAGGNAITEVEGEKERGIQIYEAAWKVNGMETEAEVTADGILLEMEEGVAAEDVPEGVRATAEKVLKGAAQIHYERHTVVFYEAEGKVNGKEKEVSISPSGKKMHGENGDDEDDDDGDDDDDDDDDGDDK